MDREELPFNRAQRSWVYRAAKDLNNRVAFGSTRDLRPAVPLEEGHHPATGLQPRPVEVEVRRMNVTGDLVLG